NFAASNGGQTVYRDADTLNVEAITVDGMTITGITTSADDVKLTMTTGNLSINEAVSLGTGDLFLDVTGNVTQQAGDDITAGGLGLMVDGNTTLDNAGNNVSTLAADNMGTITYRDADTLTVDSVMVDGMMVTGIFTTNDPVTINVLAGNLNILQAVNTRGGNLQAAAAADITSSVVGTVTTTGTIANQDSGTVQLTGGQNVLLAGTVDASGFDNVTGTDDSDGGDVTINTVNGNITTAAISAVGGSTTDPTIMGEGGTITLNANDAGAGVQDNVGDITVGAAISTSTELAKPVRVILNAEEDVNINAAITTRGASVDVDATENITSDANGDITTTGDRINEDSGDVTMDAGFNVTLAGDITTDGFLNTTDAQDSDGGNVTVNAGQNITVEDIDTSGGAVNTGVGGDAGAIAVDAGTAIPGTITLNGDLTAAGGTGTTRGDGSSIIINDPTRIGVDNDPAGTPPDLSITRDIVINTSGDTSGDVRFTESVDGVTAFDNDLTIIAGTTTNPATTTFGNVDFDMNVGGNTALGDISVDTAKDVSFSGTVNAKSLTQLSGIGSTTLDGDVTVTPAAIVRVTFDPSVSVSLSTDNIDWAGHGLETGVLVGYENGGDTDIPGLDSGETYAVIKVDNDTIQLAATRADADVGTQINLTGVGTGATHAFTVANVQTFDGSTAVTEATDAIKITGHNLETGDSVVYDSGSGGTPDGGTVDGKTVAPEIVAKIPGLEQGHTYVVIKVDANNIRLAENHDNAEAGTAIDISKGLGKDHSIAKVSVSINTADAIDVNGNITAEDGMIDGTAATGEQIVLSAATIDVAAMLDITTAIAKPAGSATLPVYTATGDKIRIIAGTALVFDNSDELITDGGIANTFEPGLPALAIAQVLQNQKYDPMDLDALLSTWKFNVGATGEVNLQVNIDWRDPVNDMAPVDAAISYNTETSSRYETFTVGTGGNSITVGHVYSSLNDFIPFVNDNQPKFFVDFSVSHHDSIRVAAPNTVDNASNTPTQNSTDDPTTGSFNPLAAANIAPDSANFTGVGSLDVAMDNQDLHFEDGLLEVVVPTISLFIPDPVADPPDQLAPAAAEPLVPVPDPVLATPAEPVDFPTTSLSTQSEDFFELRQNSTDPVVGFEHIDDDIGWKLLQPKRLKDWVYSQGLDGAGFELWLVTTKVRNGEDVTFERPVLKFDVVGNQPFPTAEDLENEMPELRLEPLDVDENGNLIDDAPDGGTDAAPMPEEGDNARADSGDDEVEALVVPRSEATSQMGGVSGAAAQSAMAGLAVSQLLGRKRRTEAVSSPHTSMISRILNRGTEQK
ncbi:MAG: hypothetical protein ABGZ53_20450, partial [Fuerstiella sp.]